MRRTSTLTPQVHCSCQCWQMEIWPCPSKQIMSHLGEIHIVVECARELHAEQLFEQLAFSPFFPATSN